ncbi:MAG TPA: hypothetical protein VIY49_04355 [Bryobacteraceae bacterium]
MKSVVQAIAVGFVFAASLSAFSINYNSSKSNSGNFALSYPDEVLAQAQAAAVLAELDKAGNAPTEAVVREILTKLGVPASRVKTIRVIGITSGGGSKGYGIMLLEDSADEATARASLQRALAIQKAR